MALAGTCSISLFSSIFPWSPSLFTSRGLPPCLPSLDVALLSQYPHEQEILLAPLCGIEVQRSRVQDSVIIIEAKLSVNLASSTIEAVQGKMRTSHISLLDMLIDEMRVAGAPKRALTPLNDVKEEALNEDAFWFNDPEHYVKATTKALGAQQRTFELLGDDALWEEHTPTSSTASTPAESHHAESRGDASCGANVADDGTASPPEMAQRRKASGDAASAPSSASGLASGARRLSRSVVTSGGAQGGSNRSLLDEAATIAAERDERARESVHDRATRMFNTSRLCSGTGHHDTAIRLLKMSVSLWPLRRDSPRARIVQAAMHSAGMDEKHRWRLEAAVLTEGMMQPWPTTLACMVSQAKDPKLNQAFATLCETLDDTPRFEVGAQVLCWPGRLDSIYSKWQSGIVLRERHGFVRDVRLDSGEVAYEMLPHAVLAIALGGPGAVLRSCARYNLYNLLETLLRRGVSPFEAGSNAETALHRAAYFGHADCCRLLLEHRASPASCDLSGTSSVNVAVRQGHPNVLRVFTASASDLDLTAFAQTASPLLQAAASGSVQGVVVALDDEDVDATYANSVTALHVACRRGHAAAVGALIHNGASVIARTKRGISALLMALDLVHDEVKGDEVEGSNCAKACEVVKLLLEADRRRVSAEVSLSPTREHNSHRLSYQSLDSTGGSLDSLLGSLPTSMQPSMRLSFSGEDDKDAPGTETPVTDTPAPLKRSSSVSFPRSRPSTAGTSGSVPGIQGRRPSMLSRQKSLTSISASDHDKRGGTEYSSHSSHVLRRRSGHASVRLLDLPSEASDVPLLAAARMCSDSEHEQKLLTMILDAGANVNVFSRSTGFTPLMLACRRGSVKGVQALLERGANPYAEISVEQIANDASFRTALEAACYFSRADCVKIMANHVSKRDGDAGLERLLNQQSGKGRTALMRTCIYCSVTTARELLDLKANPNLSDSTGYSALTYACSVHNERAPNHRLVALLIASDADPDQVNSKTYESPLMLAAGHGHSQAVCVLLQAGADIHYKRPTGETALLRAARTRDERCVRQLLLRGAHVLVTEEEGRNALHIAAMYGCDAVLNVLLAQSKVSELVNEKSNLGLTPLMIAAKHGWWKCVRSLVSCADCDLAVTSPQGRTAMDLAQLDEHFACVTEIVRCEQDKARSEGRSDDQLQEPRVSGLSIIPPHTEAPPDGDWLDGDDGGLQ